MSPSAPSPAWLAQAERNLPRYTSYPTALKLQIGDAEATARRWLQTVDANEPLSVYVHVPFCDRLCWYCGCHTTVVHEYDRVAAYHARLLREIDLWRDALGPHAGIRHLHFGGGSPNALKPRDFLSVVRRIREAFGVQPDAELAAELDPGSLTTEFLDVIAEAGLTRVSLGVQTFDADVQNKVNRIQPFDHVAAAVDGLRARGVEAINFDLMYGLPGQTPEIVAESVRLATTLAPARVAVFGYAHVPWMKKHQVMIHDAELADAKGRWAQADAADAALDEAGYVRIGFDHYARADDSLAVAAAAGELRRNFQGYTDDPAPVLIPIGPSSIGRFAEGLVQNHAAMDAWAGAVDAGRLPAAKTLALAPQDLLRGEVIERLMCEMAVDVAAIARKHGFAEDALDGEIHDVRALVADGFCEVEGRTIRILEPARRLMRVVAACFDEHLPSSAGRHAKAV